MLIVTKDSEARLLDLAQNLKNVKGDCYALHFHLSRLQERYKSDFQIKIAVNIINDLATQEDGGIFVCQDNDIFIVIYSEDKTLVEKIIFQLRYLFIDDPLAYTADETENRDFCDVYIPHLQSHDFIEACKRKVGSAAKNESKQLIKQKKRLKPLTPAHLARIEPDLYTIDLSQVLRTQPVCAALRGNDFRVIFQEFYVHIPHLRQQLKTDVDLSSNSALFRYFTEILDYRILNLLQTHSYQYLKIPLSINLNVNSLFSEDFAKFDATIERSIKHSIIFEIHIADVFSNINAFTTAREQVQKLGYRICLDGLNSLSFAQVDRERLGFDLAKLQWNADHSAAQNTLENQRLHEAVRRFGPNRVILCRCDSPHALPYGQSLGISLFQGRYFDNVLNPLAKVVN